MLERKLKKAIAQILLIIAIIIAIKLHQQPEISYDDGITCKNYFTQITINLSNKEVKRDNKETSLKIAEYIFVLFIKLLSLPRFPRRYFRKEVREVGNIHI